MSKAKPPKPSTVLALQKLGLSENEAELYTYLVDQPALSVRQLQTKTPFPRTLLYYILGQLTQRGLIHQQGQANRSLYSAVNPDQLNQLLYRHEEAFKEDMQSARESIAKLRRQYQLAGQRPEAKLIDGSMEYEKALSSLLLADHDGLIMTYEIPETHRNGRVQRQAFERERSRRKINKHTLFISSELGSTVLDKLPYDDYTKYRLVTDKNVLPFSVHAIIAGNTLLYTKTTASFEPVAVLMQDEEFLAMHKSLFALLWKDAKRIVPNFNQTL